MRRSLSWVAAAFVLAVSPTGLAFGQVGSLGVGADPFSFYYGYYLPHQAAIAAQPTPLDTINANVQQRQYQAQTERSGLYDPISPYGDEDLEGGGLGRKGGERKARISGFTSSHGTQGTGPPGYYNRTAAYFPGLKAGRGVNRNVGQLRGGRGGGMGAGGGMPSMGASIPGGMPGTGR